MSSQTTLVLPCYNHAHFLRKCIGGLLKQKKHPKIVFIDDCSTDDSLAIAKELLDGRPGVRIVSHPQNLGSTASINAGLNLVDTPFVAFAAADDFLYPDFLELSETALLNAPEAALATSRSNIIDENGDLVCNRPAFPPAFKSAFIPPQKVKRLLKECDNFFLGNVTLYKTKYLKELHGFDEDLKGFSDGLMMRSLALRSGFVFLNHTLGEWRSHSLNFSKSHVEAASYAEELVDQVQQFITRGNLAGYFPDNYDKILLNRLKFGAARIILDKHEYDIKDRNIEHSLYQTLGSEKYYKLLSFLPSRKMRWLFSHLFLYYKYKPYQSRALLRLGYNSLTQNLSWKKRLPS